MKKDGESYQSPRIKREYLVKKERTEFERALRQWLKQTEYSNWVLTGIAMILLGIFIRLVMG